MDNNNETKNKNGAGKKIIPVFYSTVPNILIQTKMLERIERQLAILFYSCIPLGGCNWSEEALKTYCECGPYHLKRAIKRLQHRRMLTVVDGGWKQNTGQPRRETNRYIFERNPYKWKVTEEVQEKIVQQTYELNMVPEPFEQTPFKNDIGFEKSFSHSHKKYAEGRKGRKNKGSENWEMKTLELSSRTFSFFEMASLCLENYDHIQIANSPGHKMRKDEADYFKNLWQVFENMKSDDYDLPGSDVEDYLNFEQAKRVHGQNADAILKYMIEKKSAG